MCRVIRQKRGKSDEIRDLIGEIKLKSPENQYERAQFGEGGREGEARGRVRRPVVNGDGTV